MGALVGVAILLLGVLVVAASVRRSRQSQAAREQLLVQSGFRPCQPEQGRLEEIVRSVRDSSMFEVRKVWKRATANAAIYWYEVASEAAADRDRCLSDEFLCCLERRSREPFLLYLKPAELQKGFGSSVIQKLLAITAPAGLHPLDLSQEPRSADLIAAFGPKNASLRDLLDDQQLELLSQGARHGVFVIRGRNDHCTLELFDAYARRAMQRFDWRDSWSFVERVGA